MSNNLIRQPNFGVLVVMVWPVVAFALLFAILGQTAEALLDTDDAMRLVEMRAWLAGQGWFDMHSGRVQPPGGYDSHWSRLIDAGLAGLYLLARYFDPQLTERLMRAFWPLLWLLSTIAGMKAIALAHRRARGRDGGTAARGRRRAAFGPACKRAARPTGSNRSAKMGPSPCVGWGSDGRLTVGLRVIKSLRRKGSLLYEP